MNEMYHKPYFNLTNSFLVAMPSLDGEVFERSVAYVCEHSAKGTMALILNRPLLNINFRDIVHDLNLSDSVISKNPVKIRYGGPVNQHFGCVIHRATSQWQNTIIDPSANIAITRSADIITALAKNQGPNEAVFTLGFSGWEAGQLEDEITNNCWLVCPSDSQLIFDTPPEKMWRTALSKMGIKPHYLVDQVGHA